jgi:hypothetical protein
MDRGGSERGRPLFLECEDAPRSFAGNESDVRDSATSASV